jgi:acyl-coenzyme A thioesterase PaaI-like protein
MGLLSRARLPTVFEDAFAISNGESRVASERRQASRAQEREGDEERVGDEGSERRAARRAAVGDLAQAVRALADAAAETGVADEEVAAVADDARALAARLQSERHRGPYSGLHGPTIDHSTPVGSLPLSPAFGDCNPSAPDVRLWFDDGRVRGTARLTRRHVGPPGVAHGGVGALIADQLVAVTPMTLGLVCVTESLTVRYRRPIPLDVDLALGAECERVSDDRARAWCTIATADATCLEGEAQMVVAPQVISPARPGPTGST